MSPNDPSALHLPAASIEAILSVAGSTGATRPFAPDIAESIGQYLSAAFARTIRRAKGRPFDRSEVKKLERAYIRFAYVIDSLQDRDDPPPRLPTLESGETPWRKWIASVSAFGFGPGNPGKSDWSLVAELLAVYETVSGKAVSTSHPEGGTMLFLETAMRELAQQAPADAQDAFTAPEMEALKKQLFHPRKCKDDCPDYCDGNSFLRAGINRQKMVIVPPLSEGGD